MLRCMRTTLSLDDDVAALLKRVQSSSKASFKEVVNAALREGLYRMDRQPARRKRSWTQPADLGECYFPNLDNVQEVLDEAEGPWRK